MIAAVLSVLAMIAPAHKTSAPPCRRVCRERKEMRRYKRRPLPWCTWGPESGRGRGEWSMTRYRQPNMSGGTGGGKFQIIVSTWRSVGGRGQPHHARPVVQERLARRVRRSQGLGAWVGC